MAGRAKSAALTAATAVLAHPVLVAGALVTLAVGLLLDGPNGVLLPVAWVGVGVAGALARRPGMPGRTVSPQAEPELAALVGRVAEAVGFGQRVVVRIVPEPTASLARPRIAGTRTYVLVLGWHGDGHHRGRLRRGRAAARPARRADRGPLRLSRAPATAAGPAGAPVRPAGRRG